MLSSVGLLHSEWTSKKNFGWLYLCVLKVISYQFSELGSVWWVGLNGQGISLVISNLKDKDLAFKLLAFNTSTIQKLKHTIHTMRSHLKLCVPWKYWNHLFWTNKNVTWESVASSSRWTVLVFNYWSSCDNTCGPAVWYRVCWLASLALSTVSQQ